MAHGFQQTMADNTPPFRWYWHGMQLDLVPLDEKVLGFANPGTSRGLMLQLRPRCLRVLHLRHLSAPYFMATKLEAFKTVATTTLPEPRSGGCHHGGGWAREERWAD